jgi:hypothetical protein
VIEPARPVMTPVVLAVPVGADTLVCVALL